jgi:hypothetical protein
MFIGSFYLRTNTRTTSPLFGTASGNVKVVAIPSGKRLVGIYGRSGDSVDSLKLMLGINRYPSNGRQGQERSLNSERSSIDVV